MIVILMGVSGSGKTTIGRLLSDDLQWEYLEADDFHPAANVDKMRRGIPLDDTDRAPWLAAMAGALRDRVRAGQNAILGASALKRAYRKRLRVSADVKFVYLKGSPELIRTRLEARRGHFFSPELLRSQFEALEEPSDALVVDVISTPSALVHQIKEGLTIGH